MFENENHSRWHDTLTHALIDVLKKFTSTIEEKQKRNFHRSMFLHSYLMTGIF